MRLDIFLKLSRLVPRRTLAKKFAKAGLVRVNGTLAKSSREISIDDEILISYGKRISTVRVVDVPNKKQVSKKDARKLYELISEKILEDDPLL